MKPKWEPKWEPKLIEVDHEENNYGFSAEIAIGVEEIEAFINKTGVDLKILVMGSRIRIRSEALKGILIQSDVYSQRWESCHHWSTLPDGRVFASGGSTSWQMALFMSLRPNNPTARSYNRATGRTGFRVTVMLAILRDYCEKHFPAP